MWQIHDSPYSLDIYIATCDNFFSIYPPSGRLSHLVNPKGETCRCTTAPLNPFPALFQPPPSNPAQPVVGAVQTAPEPSATPPGWSTKAAFTSTFWWPSEGNVVVAGRCLLDHRSTALYQRVITFCLLWLEPCRGGMSGVGSNVYECLGRVCWHEQLYRYRFSPEAHKVNLTPVLS